MVLNNPPIKVYQTSFTSKNTLGNCLAAALATILQCKIEDLPDLSPREDNNQGVVLSQLITKMNYDMVRVEGDFNYNSYYIASGWTTRTKMYKHVVVMKNGKMYHDPHPSNEGIAFVDSSIVIAPVDSEEIEIAFSLNMELFTTFYKAKLDNEYTVAK